MKPKDHAIDMMLKEDLGGITPPDLHDRILLAAARRGAVELPLPSEARVASNRLLPWLGFLIGAAAVLISIGIWPEPGPSRTLTGQVNLGTVTFHAHQVQTLPSGMNFSTSIARGDRWLSGPSGSTRLKLDELGVLTLSPNSEIEVIDMVLKDFRGGVMVGAVTVAVVAGAAEWFGGGDVIIAGTGEQVSLSQNSNEGRTTELTTQLDTAKRRIAELELSSARVPSTQEAPAATSGENKSVGALFEDSKFQDVMAEIDWEVVGESINDYLIAHDNLVDAIANGEEVTMQMRSEENEHESRLFSEVAELVDAGLPGMTTTAKAHHPLMMSNLINATLEDAGVPLDEDQRKLARNLTSSFSAEDENRRASYTEDTLDLERFVGEAEMQGRYLRAMRGMLTAKQGDRFKMGYDDRVGVDPISDGFSWSKWNMRLVANSRQELADRALAGFTKDIGFTPEQQKQLAPMIEQWVANMPAEWLDRKQDNLDRAGYYSKERVRAFAKAQLQLMRDMYASLGPAQREKLQNMQKIFLPFLR